MALTGQAKTDYQREYMRKRRAEAKGLTEQSGSNTNATLSVRPIVRPAGRPVLTFAGELTKAKQTSQKGFNE